MLGSRRLVHCLACRGSLAWLAAAGLTSACGHHCRGLGQLRRGFPWPLPLPLPPELAGVSPLSLLPLPRHLLLRGPPLRLALRPPRAVELPVLQHGQHRATQDLQHCGLTPGGHQLLVWPVGSHAPRHLRWGSEGGEEA